MMSVKLRIRNGGKMTLTLLDLYNTAASQEWAMYDNDAVLDSELEDALVLALNKSILDIYSSYDFPFRERTHIILTIPRIEGYDLPSGLIRKNKNDEYLVRYNSCLLKYIEDSSNLEYKTGVPEGFYIKNDKLMLYPVPAERGMVTVEYMTLAVGENSNGDEIYSLKNGSDILSVPPHLESLMQEAIITRTMLNTIASESDENFSAYKKQADRAYRMLVKYAKGVTVDKSIKI